MIPPLTPLLVSCGQFARLLEGEKLREVSHRIALCSKCRPGERDKRTKSIPDVEKILQDAIEKAIRGTPAN